MSCRAFPARQSRAVSPLSSYRKSPGGPGGLLPQGSHRSVRARISAYGSSKGGFATRCGHTNERFGAEAQDGVSADVGTLPTSCCVRCFCGRARIASFVRLHSGISPVKSHCRLCRSTRNIRALFEPAFRTVPGSDCGGSADTTAEPSESREQVVSSSSSD